MGMSSWSELAKENGSILNDLVKCPLTSISHPDKDQKVTDRLFFCC